MSATSSIEWTDATWNPVRGCTKISPGCAHCLDPETPVLMADWTSRRIDDLREGDGVVAFDEGTSGTGVNKVYERAIVERVWRTRKPAVRITTDDGGTIIASTDHLFLKPTHGWFKAGNARVVQSRIRRIVAADPLPERMSDAYCAGYLVGATDGDGTMREKEEGKAYRDQQWYWRVAVTSSQPEFIDRLIECALRFGISLTTKSFDAGNGSDMVKVETRRSAEIATLAQLWDWSGEEFSRGWLAGIFDAEGSFGRRDGRKARPGSLRISNTSGPILDSIVSHGHAAGFQFRIENFHGSHCKTARLYGALDEIGRFFGQVRPALTYKKEGGFGHRIEGGTPKVVAVEYVGEQDLVDIQTSKRTFIANGYLTHNCYAETFAERFRGVPGHPYEQGFDLRLVPEKLAEPLKWSSPKSIFVNSMSDLFHEDVPDAYIERVARVMAAADWHTFQVLTKRAERLRDLLRTRLAFAAGLPHIWWGVSVENCRHGVPRIDVLREAPAAVRFLSIEPLLEDLGRLNLEGIHWVIVGGESGHGARPMEESWVIALRRQCESANVPFFFKQWGGVRKAVAGRELEGKTHDAIPARPEKPIAPKKMRLAMIDEIDTTRTFSPSDSSGGCLSLLPR